MSEGFGIPRTPFPGSNNSGITVDVDGTPYPGITTLTLIAGLNIMLTPVDATPTLTVTIDATSTFEQQAVNHYWIGDTEDPDVRRYTTIDDAIVAFISTSPNSGVALVIHLPDGPTVVDLDWSSMVAENPVIITGQTQQGTTGEAILDFASVDLIPLAADCRVTIQNCRVRLADYTILLADGTNVDPDLGTALEFENCRADGTAGVVRFYLDGPIGYNTRYTFTNCEFAKPLETVIDFGCGDIGEGINPVLIAEDCRFYSAGTDLNFLYLYDVGVSAFAATITSRRNEYRVELTGGAALFNLNPGNSELQFLSEDDRLLYISNDQADPLILFDGPITPNGTFVVRAFRINAANATQSSISTGYLDPGIYLETYLATPDAEGPCSLIWEVNSGATVIVAADSPYEVQPEDRLILADTSAGAIDVVPRDPADNPSRVLYIKWTGSSAVNAVTITPDAGTIDGAASYAIPAQYGAASIESNNGEWNNL